MRRSNRSIQLLLFRNRYIMPRNCGFGQRFAVLLNHLQPFAVKIETMSRDLKNVAVIKAKGLLFALIGLIASSIIIVGQPNLQTILLLAVAIWAWCRFYYFLFYVLENYAGRKRPYAGVLDAIKSIFVNEDQPNE